MDNTVTWDEQAATAGLEIAGVTNTTTQDVGNYGLFPPSSALPRIALALLAYTAPIAFFDPYSELRNSGVSTRLVEMRPRRRRFISLAQARELALRVLMDADERRTVERAEEAHLNASRWNDEDYS